jgi:hypothetical protein
MEGEVGVVGRVWGIEVGVKNGDGKAFGVEEVCKLKHGVYVALKRQWEENNSTAIPSPSLSSNVGSWVLHGAFFFLRFASPKLPTSMSTFFDSLSLCYILTSIM